MDSPLLLMFLNLVRQDTGGKDGLKFGQIFHYFLLMEQLILDKTFRISLEIVIGLLKWLLAQSFHL
jgi:hypothetical protein